MQFNRLSYNINNYVMARSNPVWYNTSIIERGTTMKKRLLIFSVLLLAAAMVLVGCKGGTNLDTDLGTFKVIHASTMDTYSTLNAANGETLLVLRMTMEDGFDETRFKSYFAAEDGSSLAKVNVNGSDYNCIAVAYQGLPNEKTVEYVLVFSVPKSAVQNVGSFQLTAPNKPPVAVKMTK